MSSIRGCALLFLLLLFSRLNASQIQNQPGTPAASPQAQGSPAAPPRQDKPEVNSRIQSQLKDVFSGDPSLSGANIDVVVDDVNITLTGSVESEGQHQRALQLASQFAQYRKVVDKLSAQ